MKNPDVFHAGINSSGQLAGNASSLRQPDGSLRSALPDQGDAIVADNRITCNPVLHGLVLVDSEDRNWFHPDWERRFL